MKALNINNTDEDNGINFYAPCVSHLLLFSCWSFLVDWSIDFHVPTLLEFEMC